jgi:hypothetical protein
MAEKADFIVKNLLTGDINVIRKLANGSSDLEVTITNGNEEQINLDGLDVSLLIEAPGGVDTKDCPFNVKSDVDLSVSCSRTDSNWAVQIAPNDLPPDVPTTVNVNIGEIQPG